MKHYSILIFDLDGTLAESKSTITLDMADVLSKALENHVVVIITGGMFIQIKTQVIDQLPQETNLSNLFILPTSGSEMQEYRDGGWQEVYHEALTDEQRRHIITSLEQALEQADIEIAQDEIVGEQIEDRQSQVTFSALGQEQSPEKKALWDPDEVKRRKMMGYLKDLEAEFDVKLGGSTSIDITLKGIDKAYGIKRFFKETGLDIKDGIFVGDKIVPGGNDWAATKTEIDTQSTSGPEQTMRIILDNLALSS